MEMMLAQLKERLTVAERADHLALMGCIHAYKATGDAAWKDYVLAQVDAGHGAYMAQLFALEQSGDESLRPAIDCLASQPMDELEPVQAYQTLPFRMAYEFRLNRMAWVNRVAEAFRQLYSVLYDKKEGLFCLEEGADGSGEATGWMLMALIDSIEECDQQLYEHWRSMVDVFREVLKGMLRAGKAAEIAAMAAYCILKAVRMGIIDGERYRACAMKLAAGMPDETHPGLRALVCAEMLMMNKAGR